MSKPVTNILKGDLTKHKFNSLLAHRVAPKSDRISSSIVDRYRTIYEG
ncbi:hypothetical protein [Moorena sp. SIO3I6]|nr:hypothetical protein [Moorena sp. SIO3I6]NEP24138.1 hypothetical protein [Moorena sp. SIO3I6]